MTNILFVDDDASLNRLLERILLEYGYHVDVAMDGLTALEMLKRRSYDVAILDNYLPKMNGLEVLRQIRELKLPQRCIMITAVDEQQLVKECVSLGVNAILVKPFEFEQLMNSIHRVCC